MLIHTCICSKCQSICFFCEYKTCRFYIFCKKTYRFFMFPKHIQNLYVHFFIFTIEHKTYNIGIKNTYVKNRRYGTFTTGTALRNLITSYSMKTNRKSQLTPALNMASSADNIEMDTAELEDTSLSPPPPHKKHPQKSANYNKTSCLPPNF